MSSVVNMIGRFPSCLVLVVVLGLGLASAYKIDDPFPSELEKDTVEDMTNEMNRLDNLNHKKKDEQQATRLDEHEKKDEEQANRLDEHEKKDEEHAKRSPISASFINSIASQFIDQCKLETNSKISEKEIAEKREAFLKALNKDYQILQHGKGSIASDESWLSARQSEVCGACVLANLCGRNDVLDHLGIDQNLNK